MNRFQIKYILWKRKASTYHLDSFVEQSSSAHLGMILAMSGDTFVCHSVGAPGFRWMEARDAAQQPAVQRRPQWKVIQPKMPTMPRLSNSGTDSLFKNFFDLKWDLTIDITGQFAFSPCHLEPWAALPQSFYHQPGFLCPESTTSCTLEVDPWIALFFASSPWLFWTPMCSLYTLAHFLGLGWGGSIQRLWVPGLHDVRRSYHKAVGLGQGGNGKGGDQWLSPGVVLLPGDFGKYLDTFLVVTTGGRCCWHLVSWGQGRCSTPCGEQDSPRHKEWCISKCQWGEGWGAMGERNRPTDQNRESRNNPAQVLATWFSTKVPS